MGSCDIQLYAISTPALQMPVCEMSSKTKDLQIASHLSVINELNQNLPV